MRAFLLAALLALVLAADAAACSCAQVDPRKALASADAAVIGTVVRSEAVGERWITHLRVERAFKAELGPELAVDTGRADDEGGGGCTLMLRDGVRVGLFLGRDGEGWASGLCSMVEPDSLARAAEALPAPLGRGKVALVASIDLPGRRLAALDRRGRVLVYGAGRGGVGGLVTCPGGRRLLELRTGRIVVRGLPGLQRLRAVRVPERPGLEVRCRDRAARDLLVLVHDYGEPVSHGRLLALAGGARRTLYRGTVAGMAVARGTAYLSTGRWGRELLALDLATTRTRALATTTGIPETLAVAPGGRSLAVFTYAPYGVSRIWAIGLGGAGRVRHEDVGEGALGTVAWVGRDRLLFGGEGAAFRLLDAGLRTVRRYDHGLGDPRGMTVRGRTVFGVDGDRLLAARLPDLRVRERAHLPTTDVGELVPVAGAPPLHARRAAVCARP